MYRGGTKNVFTQSSYNRDARGFQVNDTRAANILGDASSAASTVEDEQRNFLQQRQALIQEREALQQSLQSGQQQLQKVQNDFQVCGRVQKHTFTL
jgi:hypothetical protein